MARYAVGTCSFLRMTIQTEAHIDFVYWDNPIHRLNRTMAALACYACVNMRKMGKANEIGQRVHTVPTNLERRALVVCPRSRNRCQSAFLRKRAMTTDTALHWWDARGRRAARVLVAVLARNVMETGMYTMTKRNRLNHVRAR